MTATAPKLTRSARVDWIARLGWGIAAVAFVAFAVVSLLNMQSGTHGDLRTTNPNPVPAPHPPVLGVANWPSVLNAVAVILTLAFFSVAAWLSVRQRRVHWSVIIGIAALVAGAVDPLANWATFTMFDPRTAHFPLSWPYFNISPLLEPTFSFLGGYASYYVFTGICLTRTHEALVQPHLRAGTWLGRHRVSAVFLTGFMLGLPLNVRLHPGGRADPPHRRHASAAGDGGLRQPHLRHCRRAVRPR